MKKERSKEMMKLFRPLFLSYRFLIHSLFMASEDLFRPFDAIVHGNKQNDEWGLRALCVYQHIQPDEKAKILWLLSSKYETYKIFMLVCNIAEQFFSFSP